MHVHKLGGKVRGAQPMSGGQRNDGTMHVHKLESEVRGAELS